MVSLLSLESSIDVRFQLMFSHSSKHSEVERDLLRMELDNVFLSSDDSLDK